MSGRHSAETQQKVNDILDASVGEHGLTVLRRLCAIRPRDDVWALMMLGLFAAPDDDAVVAK